jgi:hypothetical protein
LKILLFTVLFTFYLYPQCSDAGVCSIGDHSIEDYSKSFSLGLSFNYGYSGKTDDISYSSLLLEGNYYYTHNSSVYLSLPYSAQSGPLGDVSGFGDLLILINQNVYSTENFHINLQGGAKFETGSDNAEDLPQNYQSGLGSNDLLVGTSIRYYNFNAAVGYQFAGLRNNNKLRVKRGDDFLISAGYDFTIYDKSLVNFQLLMIKRLSQTSIIDTTHFVFINVPESDNLQINAALTFSYSVSESMRLKFFGAVPFKKRPVNIDGLTRSISLAAGVYLNF